MGIGLRQRYRAAIVTGASSGIGAALARRIAAEGVPVGLTARRADLLETLAAAIRAEGGTAVVAPADAADSTASRAAFAHLSETLGPVDLLILNAGVSLRTPAEGFSSSDFRHMIAVNMLAPADALEIFLPAMLREGRGQIVGVSSLAGYRGIPGNSGYSATKSGLTALLEGVRAEVRGRGVDITVVHPGFVRTTMIEEIAASGRLKFVVEVDRAAKIILRGIVRCRPRVDFPWPMAALAGLGRLLPSRFYDELVFRFTPIPASRADQ